MDLRQFLSSCLLLTLLPAAAADVTYSKKFGDWTAIERLDPMTDVKQCLAVYVNDKNIRYTSNDAVKISYMERGGVTSFRYRFGKAQASNPESVMEYENNLIVVPIFFAEALDMPYLRISGTTVLKTAINLEISLKGLKAAREALASRCELPELPSVDSGQKEWGRWQVLPVSASQ